MEEILREVEVSFSSYFTKKYPKRYIERLGINICCSPEEITLLLELSQKLKSALSNYPKYRDITDKDICIAIIYTYYSLNLGEQTTDLLDTKIYERFADNKRLVTELWMDITTGDLMDGENNISSKIRRSMFGMEGGKKYKRKTKKARKNKKRKTKARKTKIRKR
jgi:hypothetical protein